MNQNIKLLNTRLAEALGTVGGQPRFAWMWAPDIHYYYRPSVVENFTRHCWADRVGKVWMLCQFRAPTISAEQWYHSFAGELPYPARGMYQGQPETAIEFGMEPTAELTAAYIRSIGVQMSKNFEAHLREINEGLERDQANNQKEFFDCAEDSFPAFWKNGEAHEAGKRGAHVSFGGV